MMCCVIPDLKSKTNYKNSSLTKRKNILSFVTTVNVKSVAKNISTFIILKPI